MVSRRHTPFKMARVYMTRNVSRLRSWPYIVAVNLNPVYEFVGEVYGCRHMTSRFHIAVNKKGDMVCAGGERDHGGESIRGFAGPTSHDGCQ